MLSDKIKALRKEHNMTQNDLAQRLNVAQGSVAMWETDKRTPDVDMLKKISACFNVSVDYLIGNQNENISDDSSNKAFFRLKKFERKNRIIPFYRGYEKKISAIMLF